MTDSRREREAIQGNPSPAVESFSDWAEHVWKSRREQGPQKKDRQSALPQGAGEREIHVQSAGVADTGQRILKFVEEGQTLFGLLPGFLDETERLKAKVEAREQECEQLRQQNAGLRKEQEEIVAAFGELMGDMLQPMNELMQKIRDVERKNPVEREPNPTPPAEATRFTSSGVAGR